MKFEWDPRKNELNIRERRIDFADTQEMFRLDFFIVPDSRRDYGENRFIGMRHIRKRLMVVAFTKRRFNIIRIISLRKTNKREQTKFKASLQN